MVKAKIKKSLDFFKKSVTSVFSDEIIAPLFSEWGRKTSWGLLIVFVFLSLGSTISAMTNWHADYILAQTPSINHSVLHEETSQLIAQIPEEHLFGRIGVDDQDVPITSLQLRLIGINKSDDDANSHVIISEESHPGKVYAVGDSLPSGITVNAIANDGVILENGGHLEKLPLPRTQLSFQGMPKPLLDQENEV